MSDHTHGDELVERLLRQAPLEPPPPRLREAVMALARPRRPVLWPFGPLWQPAAVLAASLLLGVMVGPPAPRDTNWEQGDEVMSAAFAPDQGEVSW